MGTVLDDAARDDLVQLLGHLQAEFATPSGQEALLAELGIGTHLLGTHTGVGGQDVLTPRKTSSPAGQEEVVGAPSATSARQFAARLVDHLISAQRIDGAIALLRRIEGGLAGDDRTRADALKTQLEGVVAAGNRAGLGWVGYHHVHKYTLTDRFLGRREYLERMDRWALNERDDAASVLCLSALGGVGKSALAAAWLETRQELLRQHGIRGAFWCSFYAKDFAFTDFTDEALSFVGQLDQRDIAKLSRKEREQALIERLRGERFVLVADGLERLMNGYTTVYDRVIEQSGDAGVVSTSERALADPRDANFLQMLAQKLASRVLITTRLDPADLERPAGGPRPYVDLVPLGGFTNDEGLELWRSILPDRPIADDLIAVLVRSEWHPLVISVLARSVAASGGDWDRWWRVSENRDIRPIANKPVEEARAYLINMCLRDLHPSAMDVLGFLATSGKPMPESAIEKAMVSSASDRTFGTVEPLRAQLQILQQRGFIGVDHHDEGRSYDVHPIVRGAVWGFVTDPERKGLMSHAVSELLAKPDYAVTTDVMLEDLGPAISYYQMLVDANEPDRAWEMFARKLWPPLMRSSERRVLLDLLFRLLPDNNRLRLIALESRREQATSTEFLGSLLMSVGEGRLARVQLLWAGAMRLQLGDGRGFLEIWHHRTWQSLYEGRLYETEIELRQMVVEAITYGTLDILPGIECWLGLVLSLRGRCDEAKEAFRRASEHVNARWWAQGVAEGYVYLNQPDEALEWVTKAIDAADPRVGVDAGQRSWELVTQGIAFLQQGKLEAAENVLIEALLIAKRTSYAIIHAFAEVYLADVYLRLERIQDAEEHVENYFRVDRDCTYRVVAADAFRVVAECALARGDMARAADAAEQAYRLAACDGPPFVYLEGLKRARRTLDACGVAIPFARSHVSPGWRDELEQLRAAATRAHTRLDLAHRPDTDAEARDAIVQAAAFYTTAEDDRLWLASTAGSSTSPLYKALILTLAAQKIDLTRFRRAFENSPHQSLEVTFLEMERDRIVTSRPPTIHSLTDDDARAAWLAKDHRRSLDQFMRSEEGEHRKEAFEVHHFDADGIEAFLADDLRRLAIDSADDLARRWWDRLSERGTDLDVLVLAESLRDQQVTLVELVEGLPLDPDHAIEYALACIRVQRAEHRLQVRSVSKTEGWSEVQVLLRLQDLKHRLGWSELDEAARAIFLAYEDAVPSQSRQALTLVEEIARRGATLPDYIAARTALRTDDVTTLFSYLEYERARDAPWSPPAEWQSTTATEADVTTRLHAAREELGWRKSADVQAWWLEQEAALGAPAALRLLRELRKRDATIAMLFLASQDTSSRNIDALLAYVQTQRSRPRGLGDDETLTRAAKAFSANDYATAISQYDAAIRMRPTPQAYRDLSNAWENATHVPKLTAYAQAVKARVAVLAATSDESPDLDRRRLEDARTYQRIGEEYGYHMLSLVNVVTPLVMEIAGDLIPLVEGEGWNTTLRVIEEMRTRVLHELGVRMPGLRLRGNETDYPDGTYTLMLDEAPVASGVISASDRFTTVTVAVLRDRNVAFREGSNVLAQGSWIAAADAAAVPEAWEAIEYPIRHLEQVLHAHIGFLNGHTEIEARLEASWTETAKQILAAPASNLTRLVQAVGALLKEGVSSDPIAAISECFWPLAQANASLERIVNALRMDPAIRPNLPGNRSTDSLVRLSASLEASLVAALVDHGEMHVLAMDPEAAQKFLSTFRNAGVPPTAVLVVESSLVRPYVRSLIEVEFTTIFVVARVELLPGWETRVVATVEDDDE